MIQSKKHISRKSAVNIAAAITAKARLILNTVLIEMSDHVYYCDTDSVYLDCYLRNTLTKVSLVSGSLNRL